MAVTRINNNQISDASLGNAYVGINAASKVQSYSITSTKLANNLTYGSDLTVTGNLIVQGNTTSIDTTYTTIEDPILLLASNQTGSPSVDIGFVGERGTSDNIAFVWDESAGEFVTVYTTSGETNTTITIAGYADLHTGNANIGGNVTVNGATTFIGNVTGNLTVSGNVRAPYFIGDIVGNITGNVDAGGADTQVQFNDNELLNGSSGFTFNKTSNAVAVAGNISSANLNASANVVSVGVAASGNISGGNLLTAGLVSATGNIVSVANINGANLNITSGITATSGYFTGNVDVLGNLNATVGVVYANSGIFYGDAVTGNNAAFAGIPGYTPLGSNVVMQFAGNVNSYSQLNFQNINSGNLASTDIVATANDGDDNNYYIDIGINSSTFDDPIDYPGFNPHDSYVHVHGGNLLINPETAGKVIKLMVGGTANSDVIGTVSSTGLDIVGSITANGNVSGGNLVTGGQVAATGIIQSSSNITGANLVASAAVIATGNVTGGNLLTGGIVNANGNIISAANIAGGNLTITSAINTGTLNTTGNAVIAGNLFVLGNITYNNVNDLRIEDPVIILGTGPNGAPLTGPDSYDRGIFMEYYTSGLGNAWMGWQNSTGNMIAASNVSFSGNDIIQVNSYGTFQAGNIYAQSAVVTGNISGSNLNTDGQVVATGNITGGNLITPGLVSATGNVYTPRVINGSTGMYMDAGYPGYVQFFNGTGTVVTIGDDGNILSTGNISGTNILTGGIVSATGNITGGNLITPGLVSATGNVNAAAATFLGNVTAQNFIGNISGNVDAGGANTQIQFNDNDILNGTAGFTFDKTSNAVVITGNISGANLLTAGLISATGIITSSANINGANVNASAQVIATGNVTGGNIITGGIVSATGNVVSAANVNGANVNATTLVASTTITATGNITGANVNTSSLALNASNINSTAAVITVNSNLTDVDFAVNGDGYANVFYVDAGTGTASFGSATQTTNAIVAFNSPTSILFPVGNTAQRPGTGITGMIRFNTTLNAVEVYDNSNWETVGTPVFTVISDQQFNGDGVTVAFTLSAVATTNSVIVSINGVVQIPTIAYSVSETTLTFTEAPQSGDLIDVRNITTTTQVTSIANSPGNAVVAVNPTSASVEITGDLLPTANVTYDLGSTTARWNELWLAGSTITLGNTVIKNVPGGNTIGFFGPDGSTPATIAASSVDTTQIASGTSNMAVIATGGNIRANIAGATIQTISATGVEITGDLSVTGNATLSGNILGDRVQNGTTSFDIQTQNGNANITIGGTSNVAVFSTAGANISGTLGVTGNITGSYILGNGSQLTGIDATSIQNGTSNVRVVSSGGNVTTSVGGTSNVVVFSTAGANIAGYVTATGNVTGSNLIATTALFTPSIVNSGSNGAGNIGSSTTYFNTVFAKATSAQYADLAEIYAADAEYAPGTVLSFGGDKEVTVSDITSDARIAGVVSTNPSYIMNSTLESEYTATVALTGRVPTLVSGPVAKGDMMVSAGNGRAIACAAPTMGTVIGKALENHAGGDGVIEVVVGRL